MLEGPVAEVRGTVRRCRPRVHARMGSRVRARDHGAGGAEGQGPAGQVPRDGLGGRARPHRPVLRGPRVRGARRGGEPASARRHHGPHGGPGAARGRCRQGSLPGLASGQEGRKMTGSHSPAFQRFQASFDAPGRAFLDQLDTAALLALEEPERTEAEDILLGALSTDDPRIVRALRDLRSTRAVAPLRAALARTSQGRMRVAVARALYDLAQDRSAISAIVDVLRRGDRSSRETAASVLRVLPVADVQPALLDALSDGDAGVRGLATSSLYALHHLDDVARDYRDRLGVLRMLIASPLPSLAAQAAGEIRSVIGSLQSGATPKSLGLDRAMDEQSPAVKRLMDSRSDEHGLWSELLDVEAIPASGPERVWAEDVIL